MARIRRPIWTRDLIFAMPSMIRRQSTAFMTLHFLADSDSAPRPSHGKKGLPKASFIDFTGTPIESGDKNTQAVFGDLAFPACHQLVSQRYHSRCRAPWSLTFTTSCNRRKT